MKEIAIFGGSFNPVTKAHIGVARHVLNNCEHIKKVFLMPCYKSIKGKDLVDELHRTIMCRLACKNIDSHGVETVDLQVRNRLVGIEDTIEELKNMFSSNKINFIMDMHNAENIQKLDNFKDIKKEINFIVVPRDSVQPDYTYWYKKEPHIFLDKIDVEGDLSGISSSEARDILGAHMINKKRLLEILDKRVLGYIFDKGLYI